MNRLFRTVASLKFLDDATTSPSKFCLALYKGRVKFVKNKLKELTKENLQDIMLNLSTSLTEQQLQRLDKLSEQCITKKSTEEKKPRVVRMSQELVDEKMVQLKIWMQQIDDGELYLDTEEYEDYSENYWYRDWVVEYYDNRGVEDKILYAIQLVKDCVEDCRYQEAKFIYEWLWQMEVSTQNEYIDETEFFLLARRTRAAFAAYFLSASVCIKINSRDITVA